LANLSSFFSYPKGPDRRKSFFEDYGVWKDAPVLIGTTKFTPLPDVKNIMVTGGAGFMYAPPRNGYRDGPAD